MSHRGLFITGTDTDVGKTIITSGIARCLVQAGHKVGVSKPVATGAEQINGQLVSMDSQTLAEAAQLGHLTNRITPWIYEVPAAPPVAARAAGETVILDDLIRATRWWGDNDYFTLVEGVGGLLCPLTESETVADMARALNFPLIIVAHAGLGTINHTLLTLEAASTRGLPVVGIVLNQCTPPTGSVAEETNAAELAARTDVPILATVRYRAALATGIIEELSAVNWYRLTGAAG